MQPEIAINNSTASASKGTRLREPSRLRKLLREPLLHFLLIGAALFVLYALLNRDKADPTSTRINVTAADIERLKAAWITQWKRAPSDAELNNLIQDRIREEVLYREALALGLERDDEIVRRRLALKASFLVQDAVAQAEPDEATLQQYFATHKDRYEEPGRISFTHIYFSHDSRRNAEADAQTVLRDLQRLPQAPMRAPERGDRFMFATDYAQKSRAEIARELGEEFARDLLTLPVNQWQGPVASGYGVHLVRVEERGEGRLPEFAAVKDQVRQDWLEEKQRTANEQAYQKLKQRYAINIEGASNK
ncbi:MAG: peptidylprolyl isomerase [Blastocatellia bacterium]